MVMLVMLIIRPNNANNVNDKATVVVMQLVITTRIPQVQSISEISSCFSGPSNCLIEIRHRVKRTSTISLFGVETLKLKIRRLKLWKSTEIQLIVCKGGGRVSAQPRPHYADTDADAYTCAHTYTYTYSYTYIDTYT